MRLDHNGLHKGKYYLGNWCLSWWIKIPHGNPNVKLGRFRVAFTSLLMTPGRGKRKGIVWTREEPR